MTFRKNEPRSDEPSAMTEAEQRLFIMTKLSNPLVAAQSSLQNTERKR